MPFSINKNTSQGNSAGLAIHDDCLRFVELDEHGGLLRQEYITLPEGCVVNESINNFDMLASAFSELHKLIGRLYEPLIIGIPAGDTLMRLLTLPNMDIEDLRGTIDLNFDEYFPHQREESVFDIIRIVTPSDLPDASEVTVLAVAAKSEMVEKLLDTARQAGIPAGAVEPLNFSTIRGIPDIQDGLSIFVSPHHLTAVFNGEGIFFRTANNLEGAQDILNTMQFIETTYRNIRVSKLILFALNFQLRSEANIEVVNISDEFLAARGLALRNILDKHKLDLRPGAYIELERRRYSFNPNRIIFLGLLIAFLMLSAGTIAFTWAHIWELEAELEDKREENTGLLVQRAELAKGNADLEAKQQQIQKILDFLKKDIPVLEVMNAIETHFSAGVKFEEAVFSRPATGGIIVNIDGKASDEKAILSMTEGLKSSGMFDEVRLPVSLKAMTGQIVFKLVLKVKEVM